MPPRPLERWLCSNRACESKTDGTSHSNSVVGSPAALTTSRIGFPCNANPSIARTTSRAWPTPPRGRPSLSPGRPQRGSKLHGRHGAFVFSVHGKTGKGRRSCVLIIFVHIVAVRSFQRSHSDELSIEKISVCCQQRRWEHFFLLALESTPFGLLSYWLMEISEIRRPQFSKLDYQLVLRT